MQERRRPIVDPPVDRHADVARKHRPNGYFTSISSTSKMSVAFGGITPPAPRSP
jgi:hypothetical protein